MGYTAWYFRRAAPGTFVPVTRDAHTEFWQGKGPLIPDTKTGDVLLAEVLVLLKDRVAEKIQSMRFDRYPVDGNGLRDRHHKRNEMAAYSGLVEVRSGDGPMSAGDRFTERTIVGEYQWEPDDHDWATLIPAINKRARRFLAGTSPVRLA